MTVTTVSKDSSSSKIYNIRPQEGASCRVILQSESDINGIHPVGEELEICIGESDSVVDDAIEEELRKLRTGETSCIQIAINPGVADDPAVETSNTNTNVVHISVKLVSFENGPMVHQLSHDQKFKLASHHKAKGVDLFKVGKHDYAFRRFSKALKYLILMLPSNNISESLLSEYNKLRVQCYSNLAACQMKAGSYEYVVANCTKALCTEPNNVKCIFRRASAYLMLQNWDSCRSDIQEGLKIEPSSKSLKDLYHKLQATQNI